MRLTQEVRAAIFRARDLGAPLPAITFPGNRSCPAEVGERYQLSSSLHLEVTAIRRTRKGEWRVLYALAVRERPVFLGARPPRVADEAARAGLSELEARGYTLSRTRSLDPEAETLDVSSTAELTAKSRGRVLGQFDRRVDEVQAALADLKADPHVAGTFASKARSLQRQLEDLRAAVKSAHSLP